MLDAALPDEDRLFGDRALGDECRHQRGTIDSLRPDTGANRPIEMGGAQRGDFLLQLLWVVHPFGDEAAGSRGFDRPEKQVTSAQPRLVGEGGNGLRRALAKLGLRPLRLDLVRLIDLIEAVEQVLD